MGTMPPPPPPPPPPPSHLGKTLSFDTSMLSNQLFPAVPPDATARKRRRSFIEDEEEQTGVNTKRRKERHESKPHAGEQFDIFADGRENVQAASEQYDIQRPQNEALSMGVKRRRFLIEDAQDVSSTDAKRHKLTHHHDFDDFSHLAPDISAGTGLMHDRNDHDRNGSADSGIASIDTPSASATTKKSTKANVRIVKNAVRNSDQFGLQVCIGGQWVPAIEHPDYVSRLAFASIDAKQYIHKRTYDHKTNDFTAYLHSQHGWGADRADRPDILFEYKIPDSGWHSSQPLLLTYDDDGVVRLVVDVINHRPLKAFPNLPVTISKKVEGWLMEAWERQDRNINVEDFIQRMPFRADDDVWENRKFSNALTQRKDRFRNRGRCISWKMVEHDREWDRKLQADMEAHPTWLQANTTRHLDDLTVAEDKALEAATLISRKHMKRATGRELKGDAKVKKEKQMREKLNDGKENNSRAEAAVGDACEHEKHNGTHSASDDQPEAKRRAQKANTTRSGPSLGDPVEGSMQQRANFALGPLQSSPQLAPSSVLPEMGAQFQPMPFIMQPPLAYEAQPPASVENNPATTHAHADGNIGSFSPHSVDQDVQLGQPDNNLSWLNDPLFSVGYNNTDMSICRHQSLPAAMPCAGFHKHTDTCRPHSEPVYPPFDVWAQPGTTSSLDSSLDPSLDFSGQSETTAFMGEAHQALAPFEVSPNGTPYQKCYESGWTAAGVSPENHQPELTSWPSQPNTVDEPHPTMFQSDVIKADASQNLFGMYGPETYPYDANFDSNVYSHPSSTNQGTTNRASDSSNATYDGSHSRQETDLALDNLIDLLFPVTNQVFPPHGETPQNAHSGSGLDDHLNNPTVPVTASSSKPTLDSEIQKELDQFVHTEYFADEPWQESQEEPQENRGVKAAVANAKATEKLLHQVRKLASSASSPAQKAMAAQPSPLVTGKAKSVVMAPESSSNDSDEDNELVSTPSKKSTNSPSTPKSTKSVKIDSPVQPTCQGRLSKRQTRSNLKPKVEELKATVTKAKDDDKVSKSGKGKRTD